MSTVDEIAEREFDNLLPQYSLEEAQKLSDEVGSYESLEEIYNVYRLKSNALRQYFLEEDSRLTEYRDQVIREWLRQHNNTD